MGREGGREGGRKGEMEARTDTASATPLTKWAYSATKSYTPKSVRFFMYGPLHASLRPQHLLLLPLFKALLRLFSRLYLRLYSRLC